MKLSKSSKKNKVTQKIRISSQKVVTRKYFSKVLKILKVLLGLVVLGAVTYLLIFSPLLGIKKVVITGDYKWVNEEDVKLIAESNALGKNIFKFNSPTLIKNLQENILGAKTFEVRKLYPTTLEITVRERVPIAIIYKYVDEYFLIDEDGYVLGYADTAKQDLPKIRYEKEIKIGLFIDKNMIPIYLELTSLFMEEDIKVSSMSFSPKHVNLYLADGPEVLIGYEKEKQQALRAVSELVRKAKLENKEIQRIDIRYDKVIVLFK